MVRSIIGAMVFALAAAVIAFSQQQPATKPAAPAKAGEPRSWRAFSADSPWNQKIPRNAELDPKSRELIDDLVTSSKWNFLGINMKNFSIPVYYVDSTKTTMVNVKCRDVAGRGFDKPVPIPADAKPDPQSDHHLCIVDKKLNIEWGMWDAKKNDDGSWMCGVGAMFDLKGNGVNQPNGKAQPWQHAHAARASGFPLIAGLILIEEIKAGRIDHALAIAYPHCRSTYFINPPASTAQGTTNDAKPDRGIPMGGLIQLDPTVNVDSLNLSKTGKIIALALQEYGAYVCDYSGAINLYAEGSPDAQKEWAGLLDTYEIKNVFNADMLKKFRVIKTGEWTKEKK